MKVWLYYRLSRDEDEEFSIYFADIPLAFLPLSQSVDEAAHLCYTG